MENLEHENKTIINTINTINNTSNQSPSTEIKKKKKKVKKQKEKKCSGLKELLEQINQEKLEKIKKAQEKQKKKIIKKESKIKSSEVIIQNDNEEKNKEKKDYINIINNSISGTTVATLSPEDFNEYQKFNFDKNIENINKFKYFDLKPNYLIKNIDIEDEKVDEENNKRKISSPICDYYDGCDKILSEMHQGSIDMSNSMNFIKKEDLIPSNFYMNNNNFNNNNYNDLNNYINPDNYNYNYNNNYNNSKELNEEIYYNINNKDELDKMQLDINNINIYNELYDYMNMNIPNSQFMDYYYNTIPENISISKFTLLNDFNCKNKSKLIKKNNKKYKKSKNKSKSNIKIPIRKGDWLCTFCSNLNFSFRNFCNKCKGPKK